MPIYTNDSLSGSTDVHHRNAMAPSFVPLHVSHDIIGLV